MEKLLDGTAGSWKRTKRGLKIVAGQADLTQIVEALCTTGRLARRLHRRQQQPDQHADDGDHNQQFNESERSII
jgi:hypothetical protein